MQSNAIPLDVLISAQTALDLVSSSADVAPLLRMKCAEQVGMLRHYTKVALSGQVVAIEQRGDAS
ncbi:hypothetical protein J2W32_004434 [Variovorax boronicumulans]|uniref:Uncharacterized protein n=1 Tax=Variovorax boronicumulans TaxID=436515 RepID=A0AAW8D624_9BURK|nr:hypothetical protein [Variovorax boronicumulans]MDP9895336.1 hypothetical protein [Variovorax boronicumulans]MDQ0055376.1 hypothetical protein [Variovorax boronicumulans]